MTHLTRPLGAFLVIVGVQVLSSGGLAFDKAMTAVVGLPLLAIGVGLLFGTWAERRHV